MAAYSTSAQFEYKCAIYLKKPPTLNYTLNSKCSEEAYCCIWNQSGWPVHTQTATLCGYSYVQIWTRRYSVASTDPMGMKA